MHSPGPDSTTGNVQGDNKVNESKKNTEAKPPMQQQFVQIHDDASKSKTEVLPANTTNASNVIPTSPQYGVSIIPTTTTIDIPTEAPTAATDTISESLPKTTENEIKDMHSTPSKNDRFKVVKIASSEPFRRGRWKCMDYVDQTPSVTSQITKTTQGTTAVQMPGNVYMQTQSLPPQQIQQLLLQGAFTSGPPPQFYQSQMVPQAQYFYPPPVQNQNNVAQPIINPNVVPQNSVQAQFINTGQQQYFQPAVIPANFQNVQFVQQQPSYQNQNSAFVPTTQNMNFQQGQTYAGQPTVTQQNVVPQGQSQTIPATQPQQPLVNGYTFTTQTVTDQQVAANNIPTQIAKNVILNSNAVLQNSNQNQESQTNQVIQNPLQNVVVIPYDSGNQGTDININSNPQFVASMHSLPTTTTEPSEVQVAEGTEEATGNPDDPAKTNPVVNAIDNKIEQAMDLVKSHLMYTVREEVEVLKEKIAELMERIQQLESENNFLRSQIPKTNPNTNGTSDQPPPPQQ